MRRVRLKMGAWVVNTLALEKGQRKRIFVLVFHKEFVIHYGWELFSSPYRFIEQR
jgi:hypothetical protein